MESDREGVNFRESQKKKSVSMFAHSGSPLKIFRSIFKEKFLFCSLILNISYDCKAPGLDNFILWHVYTETSCFMSIKMASPMTRDQSQKALHS